MEKRSPADEAISRLAQREAARNRTRRRKLPLRGEGAEETSRRRWVEDIQTGYWRSDMARTEANRRRGRSRPSEHGGRVG